MWAACLGIVTIFNPILLGFQNFVVPKLAHAYASEDAEGLRRYSLKTSTLLGMVIFPYCVALLFLGGQMVGFLYGTKYTGNGLIVAILSLDLLVKALAFSPSRALFTIERADVDFKINLYSLLFLLPIGIFLVKFFGLIGAAMGLLISDTGVLVLLGLAFYKFVRSNSETAV